MPLRLPKALTSVSWSFLEGASLAVLSFLTLVVVTRLVTPAEMGAFAIGLALIEIATTSVTMLFHDALIRKPELSERDCDTANAVTITMGFAVACLAGLGAPFLGGVFESDLTRHVCVALAPGIFISGLAATAIARHKRALDFRLLAMRSVIGRLLGALTAILAAFAGAGIWSLVGQQLVTVTVSTAVLLWAQGGWRRPRFDPRAFREMIGFATQSVAVLLLTFSLRRIFILLVGARLGVAQAGYVNIAFRTVDTFWSLSAVALQQVALPLLSRAIHQGKSLAQPFGQFLYLSGLALYPLFGGLASLAGITVALLFGETWLPAAPYVACLSLLVFLQVPRMVFGTTLVAAGFPGDQIPINLAQFALLALLVLGFGIATPLDAVLVWMAVEAIQLPILSLRLVRRVSVGPARQFAPLLRPLLASAVMLLALWFAGPHLAFESRIAAFLGSVLTGGLAYLGTAALLDPASLGLGRACLRSLRSRG